MMLQAWFLSLTLAVVFVALIIWIVFVTSRKRSGRRAILVVGSSEQEFLTLLRSSPDAPKKRFSLALRDANVHAVEIHQFEHNHGKTVDTEVSLLMLASLYDSENGLKALLEAGADPMFQNGQGFTVLHSFADRGQWKMSRIVFESLSEDKKDKFINHGNSKAVDFGDEEFDFLDIIEANDSTTFMLKDTLKTREVEVNAKTFFRTPEGELSNEKAFKAILDAGADPLWRNNRGTTVLAFLAQRGRLDMAQTLLTYVPEDKRLTFINQGNIDGWTPLHSAMENTNWTFANWLVEKGADVNAKMYTGWSVLHVAAKKDHLDAEMMLRSNGADSSVEASHRIFGNGVRSGEVNQLVKRIMDQKVRDVADMHDAIKESLEARAKGKKVLVAIMSFVDFGDNELEEKQLSLPTREGGHMDDFTLKRAFSDSIDCDVMIFDNSGQKKNRTSYEKFIEKVRRKVSIGDYGVLFCIVSSHGGQDKNGQFFWDEERKKIYFRQHLVQKFSVECCSAMENVVAIFLPNFCRIFDGSDVDNEEDITDVRWTKKEAPHLVIQVTTDGNPSFHSRVSGSVPLIALKYVLRKYQARLSVQDLIVQADKEILSKYPVTYEGETYYQGFVLERSATMTDKIFFKKKS